MEFGNFFEQLFKALGGTLYFLIGAPDSIKNIDWSALLITASVKLTIICILLLWFYSIYKVAGIFIVKLVKRLKFSQNTETFLLEDIRYFWWFSNSIAVLSQVGISYPFIKAYSRAIFVGAFFFVLWRFLDKILDKIFQKYQLNESVKQLTHNVSSVLVIILAIGALMKQFGFDLVSIVAGLGIVGIAVGFAAQSTLADFIAGVTILLERPFDIGDWVTINGHTGKIEKISLRTTHIRTRTNVSVILPNNNVASAEIINLSARKLSAYQVSFGIAYEEDISKTREVVINSIKDKFELVLNTPAPSIRVVELGDSSVNLVLLYWIAKTNIDKQVLLHTELLENIKNTLDNENIDIPYPHVQLMQGK